MPWSVKKDDRCPTDQPWAVVKDDDNELEGCHVSEDDAKQQQAALYANEGRSDPVTNLGTISATLEAELPMQRPPRDNLVRSVMPGVELRSDGDDGLPTLVGHFAVFNDWTEIESAYEGRFMEQIAPGAFKRTFDMKRDKIRVLFQHGQDPMIGDKPLGRIRELTEDARGAYYEVGLYDGIPPLVMSGLRDGGYGASFRFRVIKDDFNNKPTKSVRNPDRLPERTIQEADVMEFGPVTFPAYAGATAGVRSETDDYMRRLLVPEFDEIRELLLSMKHDHALPVGPEAPHSDDGTRKPVIALKTRKFRTREEFIQWTQRI